MARRPTYEELEQRVKELEDEAFGRKQAEEALRESEDKWRSFTNNTNDIIQILDSEGEILYMNKVYPPHNLEDVIGRSVLEFMDGESKKIAKKSIENLLRHKLSQDCEVKILLSESSSASFQVKFVPHLINEEVDQIIAHVSNIDERKQAEDALRVSEKRYRTLMNNLPVAVYRNTPGPEGEFLMVNPAFCKIFGLKNEEDVKKMSVADFYVNSKERKQFSDKIMEQGVVENDERILLKRDGTPMHASMTASVEYGKDGKISHFDCILIDITEKKQALDDLRESEQRFKEMADLLPTIICEIGMDLRITYANSLAFEKTGFTRSDFEAGINAMDLLYPDDRKMAVKLIEQTLKGEKLESVGYRLYKKDGSLFPVLLNSAPIYKGGKITGIRFSMADMTGQKELERKLLQAQKMETIGTLAGGVAHDLNNILGGLVGYPELLLLKLSEDSPLRKSILTIQESGKKAAAVVQDLLTLARRGVVVTEVINPNDVISEYLKSPEHEKLQSHHPGVQIKTHLATDTLNILGSPTHLSKTIMNMVFNAAEAMPLGGELTVITENRYIDKPIIGYEAVKEGDYVVLTVSDTGTGISPDDIKKIFEPFYTKKKMGRSGTGLGMAVVWGTVKDHNGYIDVQSIERKGTTFTLYFPATRKKLPEDKSHLAIEAYTGSGETILIVDDMEEQRNIASGMLKELGYSIVSVSSGEEAVEYLKTNKVDLLVLDMIMDPGMDGLDTYKKLIEIYPGQKAIIASGFSETDRVKELQSLGAGAYIRKPLLLEKIGLAVKEELEK